MTLWILIAAMAVVTAVIKATGPILLGGRELPDRAASVIALMAPVLLAALVVTSTFADGRHLQVGASTAGVAVAGVLIWRRHSIVLSVVVAAAVTALIRAVG